MSRTGFFPVALMRKWRAVSSGLLRAAAIAGLREPGLTFDGIRLQLGAATIGDPDASIGSRGRGDRTMPPIADASRRELALRERDGMGVPRLCLAIAGWLALLQIVQLALTPSV